jgi:AhpD family alkylhydroperoxidase
VPLDEKTRELIAVGAAIAGNCLPCLTYHFKKCRELGVSVDDIDEAIETAKTVKEVPIKKIHELACTLLEKEKRSDE